MGLIIRQSIKASLSNYAGLLIGYINILILMPRVFSPEQVGINRFIIDISGVLAGFASLGLSYSMSRFFPKFHTGQTRHQNGFTFWAYAIALTGFALLLILLLFFGTPIINLLKDGGSRTSDYIPVILPLTFIILMTLVTEQYCAIYGRIVVVNIARENGLRLANMALILLRWAELIQFNTFIFLLLISYALVLITDLVYLARVHPLSFRPDLPYLKKHPAIQREFLQFTGITLLGSFAPLIITRSDYFSVSAQGGDNALGIYAMALSIAIMTELPKRVILPIIQPVVARLIHHKEMDELRTVVGKGNINQVLIGMFILLALWLNADAIFDMMPNGDRYRSGKILILMLGVGKLIELASILPGIVINNSHYYRWNLFIAMVSMISTFITYSLAVPSLGVAGTALGVGVGYLTFAILTFIVVYAYDKMHWIEPAWAGIFLVFAAILLAHAYLPFFSDLWLNILIRSGGLLLVYAVLVYRFRFSPDLNDTVKQLVSGKFRWF